MVDKGFTRRVVGGVLRVGLAMPTHCAVLSVAGARLSTNNAPAQSDGPGSPPQGGGAPTAGR
ncbi:hypothetical protein BST45_16490 [Mycobacterium shinjukuense]|nr:hypothetical protein BST45_16490 [Mycobacterium shinjukuense]